MPVFFLTLLLQSFFPIFDRTSNEYVGRSVVNTADSEVVAEVTVTGADGGAVPSGRVILGPGEQRALLLEEILAGGSRPVSGWIRIDSSPSDVDAVLALGDGDRLATARNVTPATRLLLPDVRIDTGFRELGHTDTLVAIVMPSGFLPAVVQLDLIGLDGVVAVSVPVSIPPGRSQTVRVSEAFRDFMPDNGAGGRSFQGYLRLTSSVGVAAWQMVETPLVRSILGGVPRPRRQVS